MTRGSAQSPCSLFPLSREHCTRACISISVLRMCDIMHHAQKHRDCKNSIHVSLFFPCINTALSLQQQPNLRPITLGVGSQSFDLGGTCRWRATHQCHHRLPSAGPCGSSSSRRLHHDGSSVTQPGASLAYTAIHESSGVDLEGELNSLMIRVTR